MNKIKKKEKSLKARGNCRVQKFEKGETDRKQIQTEENCKEKEKIYAKTEIDKYKDGKRGKVQIKIQQSTFYQNLEGHKKSELVVFLGTLFK